MAPETAVEGGFDDSLADSQPPDRFPGLVLWLDAADGVVIDGARRVTTWTDRSKWKHVARPGAAAPDAVTDAWRGHAAVHFDLVDGKTCWLRLQDHSSLQWSVDDFMLLAVVKYRNPPGPEDDPVAYGSLFAKQSDLRPFPGPVIFLNNPWPAFATGGSTSSGISFQVSSTGAYVVAATRTGYNDDRIHLITALKRALTLRLRVDRENVGLVFMPDVPDASTVGIDAAIGANQFLSIQQLKGELFTLIAVRGSVEDREIAGIERYLSDRYDLPLQDRADR